MEKRLEIIRQHLGKPVHVVVDRPVGYDHHGILYPVNYGFLPGLLAGDEEDQDVYILGVDIPLEEFDGVVIGAALRADDVEDKLIAAPAGMTFTRKQIAEAVFFQEQYFDSVIVLP